MLFATGQELCVGKPLGSNYTLIQVTIDEIAYHTAKQEAKIGLWR
jgi:hypothetical protein